MSAAEIPLYRVFLLAPIDRRLGMRLDDAVELGSYEPEDPGWLPAVGEALMFQGTRYTVALPAQPSDDPSTYAGDIYTEPG
jgi:hypothetical protein